MKLTEDAKDVKDVRMCRHQPRRNKLTGYLDSLRIKINKRH